MSMFKSQRIHSGHVYVHLLSITIRAHWTALSFWHYCTWALHCKTYHTLWKVQLFNSLHHILEAKWVGTLDSTLLQGLLHPGSPQQDTAQPVTRMYSYLAYSDISLFFMHKCMHAHSGQFLFVWAHEHIIECTTHFGSRVGPSGHTVQHSPSQPRAYNWKI